MLEAAYDDAAAASRPSSILICWRRMNRELDADLESCRRSSPRALQLRSERRIEMHLESLAEQTVTVAGRSYDFAAGETIHTESSHKYTEPQFAQLAAAAGMRVRPGVEGRRQPVLGAVSRNDLSGAARSERRRRKCTPLRNGYSRICRDF